MTSGSEPTIKGISLADLSPRVLMDLDSGEGIEVQADSIVAIYETIASATDQTLVEYTITGKDEDFSIIKGEVFRAVEKPNILAHSHPGAQYFAYRAFPSLDDVINSPERVSPCVISSLGIYSFRRLENFDPEKVSDKATYDDSPLDLSMYKLLCKLYWTNPSYVKSKMKDLGLELEIIESVDYEAQSLTNDEIDQMIDLLFGEKVPGDDAFREEALEFLKDILYRYHPNCASQRMELLQRDLSPENWQDILSDMAEWDIARKDWYSEDLMKRALDVYLSTLEDAQPENLVDYVKIFEASDKSAQDMIFLITRIYAIHTALMLDLDNKYGNLDPIRRKLNLADTLLEKNALQVSSVAFPTVSLSPDTNWEVYSDYYSGYAMPVLKALHDIVRIRSDFYSLMG